MYSNYMGYIQIFLVVFSFLFLFRYSLHKKRFLNDWPFIRVLYVLLKNYHRIHDLSVKVMEKTQLNFFVNGPWFTNMKLLVTVDPVNAHYILSKSFGNYPKGSKFKEIFDVLGDGIFNVDSDLWKYHRKMAQSVFTHPLFKKFLNEKIWEKIETGLIPVLDHVSKQGSEVELQDLFRRFSFDTMCTLVMGYDLGTLCIDLPCLPFSKAMHDAEDTIFYRHAVPEFVWKLQRWLGIGQEKKFREAQKIIDDFLYECIARKRESTSREDSQSKASKEGNGLGVDLMTIYMDDDRDRNEILRNGDQFFRDTILSFFVARRDATSVGLAWFFYLLSKNPHVLSKIKEELDATVAQVKCDLGDDKIIWDEHKILSGKFEELNNKLVYLHGAICESLRLYPPVPFNAKAPLESDVLPSGHKVDLSTQIIFSMYAMGRMKSVWGEDCNDFKPERWILETGKIRYVPSYKFLAFNSGPRSCLGKNMSLSIMKAVAMAIISKYHIKPVKGHPIVPSVSMVLHMKHGFKAEVVPY